MCGARHSDKATTHGASLPLGCSATISGRIAGPSAPQARASSVRTVTGWLPACRAPPARRALLAAAFYLPLRVFLPRHLRGATTAC